MGKSEQAEMAKAKKLIQQKKYDDARAILITLENTTAEKWLDRLNTIDPPKQKVLVKKQKQGGCIRNIGLATLAFFACIVIFMFVPSGGAPSSNTSRSNPHPAGSLQPIRDGRFRVNSIRLNATNAVMSTNMFNTSPDTGQTWVLVNATFHCDLSDDSVCTITVMQFEIVGNSGRAYNHELLAVLDREFSGEVFGGGSITGDIGFIVDNGERGLVLAIIDGGRTFFDIP